MRKSLSRSARSRRRHRVAACPLGGLQDGRRGACWAGRPGGHRGRPQSARWGVLQALHVQSGHRPRLSRRRTIPLTLTRSLTHSPIRGAHLCVATRRRRRRRGHSCRPPRSQHVRGCGIRAAKGRWRAHARRWATERLWVLGLPPVGRRSRGRRQSPGHRSTRGHPLGHGRRLGPGRRPGRALQSAPPGSRQAQRPAPKSPGCLGTGGPWRHAPLSLWLTPSSRTRRRCRSLRALRRHRAQRGRASGPGTRWLRPWPPTRRRAPLASPGPTGS